MCGECVSHESRCLEFFETESDKAAEDKDGAKEATQKRDYRPDGVIKEVLISFGTLFVRHSGDAKRPLIR